MSRFSRIVEDPSYDYNYSEDQDYSEWDDWDGYDEYPPGEDNYSEMDFGR